MSAYTTDAAETEFDFDFEIYEESDLRVYYTASGSTASLLTLNSDYTVDISGSDGGTVTTTVALAAGELLIVRYLDVIQEADILEGDSLPADTIETQVDRLTMICLQFLEHIERGLFLPVSSGTTELDLPEPEANKILGWNSAGDGIENRTFESLDFSGSLTDMDDVTVTGAVKYDLLVHDGTIWRNEDHLEKLIIHNEDGETLTPLHVRYHNNPNDEVLEVARFQREPQDGAAAAGIGLSIDFYCEVSDTTIRKMGDLEWVNTNALYGTPNMEVALNVDMGGGDFRPLWKVVESYFSIHDYDAGQQLIFKAQGCGAADRSLTINMDGDDQRIDFTGAGGSDYLEVAGAAVVSQDYSITGTPTFAGVTITDDLIIPDDAAVKPTSKDDGYISIYKDGATVRIYTFVDGVRHYVDLTSDPEAVPGVGNPIGLLLSLTYAA